MVLFYKVMRELLLKRGKKILDKERLSEGDLRGFFYLNRQTLLDDYPELKEIDSKATDSLYSNWGHTMMAQWLIDVGAPLLGLERKGPPGWVYSKSMDINVKKYCMWTRFREAFKLYPKPTAVCYGEDKPFLIDRFTRELVTKDRSLILVCEKATIGQKLLDGLKARGYRVNVIGVGGCTVSNVAEVILREAEKMDQKTTNFWILVLHDFDVKGVEIVLRMKIWKWPCIIDVGINQEFMNYLKARHKIDKRIVEEPVVNKKFNRKLQEWITEDSNYSQEDFDYLQGTRYPARNKKGELMKTKKGKQKYHYRGRRIELDPIEMKYGIDVFIDFVEAKIESACRVWDLKRIGVSDFVLEEPADLYEEAARAWMQPIREVYKNTYSHICQPELRILDVVKKSLSMQMEDTNEKFQQILDEHWKHTHTAGYGIGHGELDRLKGLDGLEEDFDDVWNTEWRSREDYVGDLAKVNEQIEFYEGDVRTGKEKLQEQVDTIQERIHDDQQDEYDGSDFEDRLEEVDWGEEKLETIESPDEKGMLKGVIAACRTRIKEIDNK